MAAFTLSGLLFTFILGMARHHSPSARQSLKHEILWMHKAWGANRYDILLLGDSRTYYGVSAKELARQISPDWTAYNLGFSLAGLTDDMFQLAERRLNRKAHPPVIILGVTPHSLTAPAARNEHYQSLRKRNPLVARLYAHLPSAVKYLRPPPTDFPFNDYLHFQLHDDGWISSLKPDNPHIIQAALNIYDESFKRFPVQPHRENELLEQVTQWSTQGFLVVGFIPPVAPELKKIEDERSGFNRECFALRFQEAGGYWVEVDDSQYDTFDSSHLLKESALKLSQHLGQSINAQLVYWQIVAQSL